MENFNFKHKGSFPISEKLYNKTLEIIENVRNNPSGSKVRQDVISIVNELTAEGIGFFFQQSLEIIGMNFIARKAVGAGLNASRKTIQMLSSRFIKNFSDEQIILTVDFIEGFIGQTENKEPTE